MEASSEQDECCKWTLVLQQGCHGISQVLVKYYYYLERPRSATLASGICQVSPCQHEVKIIVMDPASRFVSSNSIGRDQVKVRCF